MNEESQSDCLELLSTLTINRRRFFLLQKKVVGKYKYNTNLKKVIVPIDEIESLVIDLRRIHNLTNLYEKILGLNDNEIITTDTKHNFNPFVIISNLNVLEKNSNYR